jgi:hypothetical protein
MPTDPTILPPAKKRARAYNRALLARLMEGTHIQSDEAERLAGKRYSARIGDLRAWLREGGYQGDDPIPGLVVDLDAKIWSWRLTGAALELSRKLVRGGRQ